MNEIKRPEVVYNDKSHTYTLEGKKLAGVSTISKIGDDEVWGIASAWGFRIGYEGAWELYEGPEALGDSYPSKDALREGLKDARLTPWHTSDKAKDRGNAIHDALEKLAQTGQVPVLADFPEGERGYVQALCKWYGDHRPSFVATEVQVVSETHSFAGRYDLRCKIAQCYLTPDDPEATASDVKLCLVDLKTGKRPYPTTQFPQLAGYELAGVEMGYPATDAQYILNVHEDGTYEFARSVATAEHFLAYLAAHRAILDIKQKSKPTKKGK